MDDEGAGERNPPGPRLRRIPALDGMRGLAVAAVLAFHAGHLEGGFLGVDLFFVLSGYLITSLLVVEWLATGTIRLRSFWAHRARRLLPALLLLLVLVGAVARWEVPPIAREPLRDAGLATLAQVANWQAIRSGNGYWDQTLLPSWLEHTWSLAIEEQIYLAWPVVALLVLGGIRVRGSLRRAAWRPRSRQRTVRLLGTAALLGAVLSAGSMVVRSLAGAPVERLYLGTDTRVAAVLLGAWVACLQRSAPPGAQLAPHHRRLLSDVAHAGAGLLLVAWIGFGGTDTWLYRGGLLFCGLAAAVVIAEVSTPGASFLGRVLAWPPLMWLGSISYGLYLYHWPIFQYLQPGRFGLDGWALTALRVGASVGVAALSLHLLELPVRERRWSVDLRIAAPAAVGVAVLVLVVGTLGGIAPTPPEAPRAATPPRPARADDVEVLVLGDSVAISLAQFGWTPDPVSPRLVVTNDGVFGCGLIPLAEPHVGFPLRDCSPGWAAVVKEIDPDVVLLLFGGMTGARASDIDGERVFPCTEAYDARYRERVGFAVDVLSVRGAQVQLVTAPYAPEALYRGEDPEATDDRERCTNDILREIAAARPEADVIDLGEWLCPSPATCKDELDGFTLRPDGIHFRESARAVARWMTPQILAAADREAGPPEAPDPGT